MICDGTNVVPVRFSALRIGDRNSDDEAIRCVPNFFAAHNDAAFFIV